MSAFHVGDEVKTEYGIGTVVMVDGGLSGLVQLVKIDEFDGHNGLPTASHLGLTDSSCLWFADSQLELVKKSVDLPRNQ